MKKLWIILLIIFLHSPVLAQTLRSGLAQTTPSAAVVSAQKKELILKFIDVFGTRTVMTKNFEAMVNAIAKQRPQEAQQFHDRIKVDEIIERLIPLYDKYFTVEDLKEYINFYSSPGGQKLVSSIGSIMKESVGVSAQYFREKFQPTVPKQ